MRNNDDAGIACLLKHRFKRRLVIRDHTDHVNATGDEVFDGLNLKRGVGRGGADHLGSDAKFGRLLKDPLFHGIEPGNAPILTTMPIEMSSCAKAPVANTAVSATALTRVRTDFMSSSH